MLAQTRALAGAGRQLLIFPEGTRVEPGGKAGYKPGVAAMYKEMQAPCLPIALNSGLYWPAHGLNFKPGTIIVQILPAIAPGLDRKTFMKELETRIETATNELINAEKEPDCE
jgi:1-acyl-sn-glycerol-3-phosphate acyltransferase